MELSKQGQFSVSTSMGSQHLTSSDNKSAHVELLPVFHSGMPVNWIPQQLSAAEKHLAQSRVEASNPLNNRPYHSLSMNQRSVQMETSRFGTPFPVILGTQQWLSPNRVPLRPDQFLNIQTSMPLILGSQPSPSTNKRPLQTEASPKSQVVKVGVQKSSNKRPALVELPPKVKAESFEPVRSKLRESLAAALSVVSDEQNKKQFTEKNSLTELASTDSQGDMASPHDTSGSTSTNACGTSFGPLPSNEPVQKCNDDQNLAIEVWPKEKMDKDLNPWNSDMQGFQSNRVFLDNEVPSDSMVVADELLQGHGLIWASDLDAGAVDGTEEQDSKRLKTAHEGVIGKMEITAESLAFRIEAELFKLFGGVNKKYKEKGRSLLFNLKDPNNPELSERVLSGDIAPERLCMMTAEELASKELSEWRLAKAEEFAQMVVLPDSDVDIRRMVRKTHKGEFQVEVEQSDDVSMEVELGANVLSRIPPKANEEIQIKSKTNDKLNPTKIGKHKASEGMVQAKKADSGNNNLSSNSEGLLNEKADLMQELMVDELKDTENLPPILSLDEFMEALDSEPPFENLSADTLQDLPTSGGEDLSTLESENCPAADCSGSVKLHASHDTESKLDSLQDGSVSKLNSSLDGLETRSAHSEMNAKDHTITSVPGKVNVEKTKTDNDLKSDYVNVQPDTSFAKVALKSESIWEGVIQFNVSSLANVAGVFRSGEKPSTKEWPSFLEIKGRVRFDAFEKFLQELPLSRSRAVMIAQFCWKEGSLESGRVNLSETIDSYAVDQRVGLAEPAPGMEIYFCPPHAKTLEMLGRLLSDEQSKTLRSTVNALIGVVVWRRPHVNVSPRLSSHHKQTSTKKQSSLRKQQTINSNSTITSSMSHHPPGPKSYNPNPTPENDAIDDVPPGFGPSHPKDEDDLPEFDFANTSKSSVSLASHGGNPHGLPSARPMDQIRELIHKYGQGGNSKRPTMEAQPRGNDEDDDIPEWNPFQDKQQKAQLPPQPLLPVSQLHSYQQYPSQPMPMPVPLQHSFQPQMVVPSGPFNVHPGWQPNQWSISSTQPSQFGGQPNGGQVPGFPNVGAMQSGMGWRPDLPGSRGF
ncbi:uncharacterized protein [Typha angustifolia]|uniref:uncharacterized protein n=1 Tax=Typha angustifolia TaxID=59011 RepID=UPI003C2F18A0